MPLSEAEREVLTREASSAQLPKPTQWMGWTEIFFRLWLQRNRIARWVAVGFLLSLFIGWRYPKFESTVQIMPPDGGSSNGLAALIPALTKSPGLAGLAADFTGAKTSGAVFSKVLESRSVRDDLIKRFDLQKHYGTKFWDDTRLKLGSRTDIVEDKKSGIIAITVHDRDPKLAMDMANAYVDELSLVTARASTSAAKQERVFIEQRLADENKNLQDAEHQFGQFASTNMALDVPEQMKVTVEAAARLQGELIAARAQVEALKQTYTEENIRVKSAQAHVNELERELRRSIPAGKRRALRTQLILTPRSRACRCWVSSGPTCIAIPRFAKQWLRLLTQQYEMARIQEAKEDTFGQDSGSGFNARAEAPQLAVAHCWGERYCLRSWLVPAIS